MTTMIPISFDGLGKVAYALGVTPGSCAVTIDTDSLSVRFGWLFDLCTPRANIATAGVDTTVTPSRGVHGWRGRWLVNGAGPPFVSIGFVTPVRARLVPVHIHVRELLVSVADPEALVPLLRPPAH